MKTLILSFLLFPIIVFSQSEQLDIDRTDFFVELKYGIHTPTNGYNINSNLTACDKLPDTNFTESVYSKRVYKFIQNIDGFVDDVIASGAGYIILNLGQSDGKYCSPNHVYEELMFGQYNTKPGFLTSIEDLPFAISKQLKSRGRPDIKLFLYLNFDGPSLIKAWRNDDIINNNGKTHWTQYFVAKENLGLDYVYDQELCDVEMVPNANNDGGEHAELSCPINDNTGVPLFACNTTPIIDNEYLKILSVAEQNSLNDTNITALKRVKITDDYVEALAKIIEVWSKRYENRVAGWVFDHADEEGTYYSETLNEVTTHYGPKNRHFEAIRKSVLIGNPEAIITFNNGAFNNTIIGNIGNHNSYQDFAPSEVSPNYGGECGTADPTVPSQFTLHELTDMWSNDINFLGSNVFRGRIVHPFSTNSTSFFSQSHMWIPMGDSWGCHNVNGNKNSKHFSKYLYNAIKENQVTTISIGNLLNTEDVGRISIDQLFELENIKSFVRDDNCSYENSAVIIQNFNSGKFINAVNIDKGTILTQNSNGENDHWIIENILDIGDEDLVRIFNTNTHKYMAVKNANEGATAKIIQDYWYDEPEQKWIIEEVEGQNFKKIKNLNSQMYATVELGLSDENRKIQQNPWFNWSSQKWFIGPQTGSVSDRNSIKKESESIVIFPNPASFIITIAKRGNSKKIIKKIELVDISGKIISINNTIESNEYSMSIENLKSGLYFVKVFTESEIYIHKIIRE